MRADPATGSFYQKLASPLSQRVEWWVRLVLGVGQAMLAALAGMQAIRLTVFLHRGKGASITPPVDPHGFGAGTLMFMLIPGTVLLGLGAVSVWRRWAVAPVLPLVAIIVLELIVRRLV